LTTLNLELPIGTLTIEALEGDALRALRDQVELAMGPLSLGVLVDLSQVELEVAFALARPAVKPFEFGGAILSSAKLANGDGTVSLADSKAVARAFDGHERLLLHVLAHALRLHFLTATGRKILEEKLN
jgi:hypothetical protein